MPPPVVLFSHTVLL